MSVIVRLAQRMRMETGKPDISGVMSSVERLLQESIAAVPYVIERPVGSPFDLSHINFKVLIELFDSGRRNTAASRLRASLEQRLARMISENPSRIEFAAKLQDVIDRYNEGSKNIEELFEELKALAASLTEEEQRAVKEELSDEELAVFDLLTKPDPVLTRSQEAQVKKVVRDLLNKLKRELLVLDWKQRQATRAAVEVAIQDTLDAGLPDVYDRALFSRKTTAVFEHVFSAYQGAGKSIYEGAAA
jgi:type I restriction enzyme R subunit